MRTHLYDVVFSVSIDDLPIAKKVAAPLEALELKIHNDRFEELTDPEKDLKRRIFQDSDICVAFVSREYLTHPFTRMEFDLLLKRAASDPEKVYFFLIDDEKPEIPIKKAQIYRIGKTSPIQLAKHLEHEFFAPEPSGSNLSLRKLILIGILLVILLSAMGYIDLDALFSNATTTSPTYSPATTKTQTVKRNQVRDPDGIVGPRTARGR